VDGIRGGANKVDLGRKGAPRQFGRLRISIANVEDVEGTKNQKRSHTIVWRISSHGSPMFEHAGRNGKVYWGDKEARGPKVVLWDSLTEEGKKGVSRRTEDNKRLGDQVGERTAETVMKI
jgi:hypothetical protein